MLGVRSDERPCCTAHGRKCFTLGILTHTVNHFLSLLWQLLPLGREGRACISSASSSLTHRMPSPSFQQHPGVVPSISLAKKCRLLLPRVRHFKNLEVRWKTQEKRMCLNSILNNEGVWSKRICGYSWETCNADHIHCTPVTCLPCFHLQHPAQGRDVHSTSHSTANPSWLHHTVKWEPNSPALWRGSWERGICWSSPLPHWLVGEESMSPLRAMPKSSLAPWAICRQVLALLPRAAAISKARYASKQAWYRQEQESLAQPALLLHLAPEQAPALGLWWQHTPYAPRSLGTPQHIHQAKQVGKYKIASLILSSVTLPHSPVSLFLEVSIGFIIPFSPLSCSQFCFSPPPSLTPILLLLPVFHVPGNGEHS